MKLKAKKLAIVGGASLALSLGLGVLASTLTEVRWDGVAFWCVMMSGITLLFGCAIVIFAVLEEVS